MKKLLSTLTILCGLTASMTGTAVQKSYPVYELSSVPVMDGKLDDAVWRKLPEARGFYCLSSSNSALAKPTMFKMGWYGKTLYIAIRGFEPVPEKTVMHTNSNDGIWDDDNIEFFIAPEPGKPYHQLVFNAACSRWYKEQDKVDTINTRLYNDFIVKGSVGKSEWGIEAAIPFRLFNITGKTPDECPFNIGRNLTTGPNAEANTTWNDLSGDKYSYHQPNKFGRLVFKSSGPPNNLETVQNTLNAAYNQAVWARFNQISRNTGEIHELALNNTDSPYFRELQAFRKKADDFFRNDRSPDRNSRLHELNLEYLALAQKVSNKVKKFRFEVTTRDADCQVFVNGNPQPIKEGGTEILLTREGLFNIAVKCIAKGANPGVKLRLNGVPYADTRWKTGPLAGNWKKFHFDDRLWKTAAEKDGFLWDADGAMEFAARQNFCWGATHYGVYSRIRPAVRKWLFPAGSTDAIPVALSSPYQYPLSNFEFIFEIPADFDLLEMMSQENTCVLSGRSQYYSTISKASSMRSEKIKRDGRDYIRWHIMFPERDAQNRLRYTLLPVRFNGKTATGNTRFYFRAQGSGNYTEIDTPMEVGFLPTINGRQPKYFALFGYCGMKMGWEYPDSLLDEGIKNSVRTGCNFWMTYTMKHSKYIRRYHELVNKYNAGKFVVLDGYLIGLRGCGPDDSHNDHELRALLRGDPNCRAVYFNGKDDWNKRGQFCPTYAVGECREKFVKALAAEFQRRYFSYAPDMNAIWFDWEENPWIEGKFWQKAKIGDGSYCFCERCKAGFKKKMGLSPDTDLPDEFIFKKYYNEWEKYRTELDGKLVRLISDTLHGMGKQFWWYDFAIHYEYWRQTRGAFNRIHPGVPAGISLTSSSQKEMDHFSEFFRNLGYKTQIAQRFIFMGVGYQIRDPKNVFPGLRCPVSSADGFIHPENWKPELLRIAATFHGGLDIESPMNAVAGIRYYLGEATRLIAEYENVIIEGERNDKLAESKEIAYPNLLVMVKDKQRLVFLFNESDSPKQVTLSNLNMEKEQTGFIFYAGRKIDAPAKVTLTINPHDAEVIYIK